MGLTRRSLGLRTTVDAVLLNLIAWGSFHQSGINTISMEALVLSSAESRESQVSMYFPSNLLIDYTTFLIFL